MKTLAAAAVKLAVTFYADVNGVWPVNRVPGSHRVIEVQAKDLSLGAPWSTP